MTVEHDSVGHDDVWGAATRPPAWSARTTLTAVAIACALAVGGGLVIHAASGGSQDNGPGRMGGPGGWGPGGPGFPGDGARTVHSQTVVSDGAGGFTTELSQTGAVTAASDTQITVRSADGYTQTFRIDPDTRQPREPLHTGNEVTVRATELNGTASATAVLPAR